jgi:hypothetical protein
MRRKAPGRHCRQAKKIRNRLWRYENMNLDMAAKRRKKHKNQISGLIISMGYETEIQEF